MRRADPKGPAEEQGPVRFYGVYPGRVKKVDDGDRLGRVLVELMAGPVVAGDRLIVWARVATLMAGKGRGSVFFPEPDDEVLIAFHAGDPRRPYVLGALWNGKDTLPQQVDSSNNIRVIKTRSGHRLEFDDTQGAAKITLTTPNGCRLVLDDGGGGNLKLTHSSGSGLEIDSSGAMKLKALGGLTVEAPQVEVNAPMTNFNGCTNHQTMIAQAVVGATYTPGAGNIW